MITPETLVRHELAGLPVRIVESTDPTHVGRAGTVVDETARTVVLAVGDGERAAVPTAARTDAASRVTVPKAACRFEFRLGGDAGVRDAGGDGPRVVVDGERLVARPARRTEQRSDSRWQ
jgi:ribonuclease P protein subunit POP4